MLLGAAILGAVASKKFSSLSEAMKALNAAGQVCFVFFLYQKLMYFYFCIKMRIYGLVPSVLSSLAVRSVVVSSKHPLCIKQR